MLATYACINKLHCILCLLFVLKFFRIINFYGFHYPRNFFNNEIFSDYGNDTIEMPEASAEKGELEKSSCISLLGDTYSKPLHWKIKRDWRRKTREMEVRKPKAFTNCSV